MMFDLAALPLLWVLVIFAVCAVVIAGAGTRLSGVADELADRSGLGEAMVGAVLLGATTSLPGLITSIDTAARGYAELSVANAVGGIAAQTVFLSLADIAYRRANLEHAAASVGNLIQGALLIVLLAIPALAMAAPAYVVFGVNPASIALIVVYVFGLRMLSESKAGPMWHPRRTLETREDEPPPAGTPPVTPGFLLLFAALGLTVAAAGYGISRSGVVLADETGLGESAVGELMTAIATSLPELVTSIAAVRRGALTLAVGGVIGGNCFDVLFLAASDIAYREGSLYHHLTERQVFTITLTILMVGILMLGMLRRERHGIANIGTESAAVIALYVGSVVLLFA